MEITMEITLSLIIYSKEIDKLKRRFLKPLLWHAYPYSPGYSIKIPQLIKSFSKTQALERESLANLLRENGLNFGEIIVKSNDEFHYSFNIKSPEQEAIIKLLKTCDEIICFYRLLWLKGYLESEDFIKKVRKVNNRFINFASQILAIAHKDKENIK